MSVDAGGRLEVERVVLERNRDVGVLVAGEGTQAVVEDLVVRGTLVRERDGALGRGVAVRSGARVELRRTLLERNRDLGLFVAGEGTEAVVEDLVVRDTRARESDGAFGYGLNVLDGGRLQLRRALVERNRGVGVFVSDEATEAVLEDVVVRDTLAQASDGAFGRGVGVQFGGRVELRRGLLERNRDVGVTSLEGAEAILEDVVVRDTRAQESDGAFGRGVEVLLGGRVELRRALLERNRDVGVSSLDGAEAILEDVVVRDTQAGASGGPSGLGLSVTFGARVELRRGLLERHRDAGVFVGHEGAEALLEDISIRETQAETAGVDRLGLNVLDGGRVDVRRGVLERNRDVGVLVAGEGTEAVLEDLVVRDTQARESDGTFGRGLNVQSGARAELRRALLERNREVGVFVAGEGTEALLEDVVVRETQPRRSDGASGSGLDVQRGARVELRRGLLERNRNLGVFVAGQGAEAVLEDLVVRDSRARESDGASGRGLNVQGGGRVELSRGLLERNRDLGLFVRGEGSRAVLEDVVVRDTQALESDGTGGEGLSAQLGGRIELRLGLRERNRSLGVLVAGAALDAEDVVVRDTLGPACRPECDSGAPGVSLGTFVESEVRLRRFELAAAEVCGLLVGHDGVRPGGGGLRLSDGLVRDHPVAVCLQDPAFPLALLQQGVRYADNAVLVDATGFPEPEPDPVVAPIEP
ncbi:MAG: right-handed parallel beta-helix repeat-containing protein [Sandaracinaceae bacterium]